MERLNRRSHATGLRWVALGLLGMGAVAGACSSDNSTPGSGPAGGEGGESYGATAGTGGKGGVAGSAVTAGTAGIATGGTSITGTAGATSGGEGGIAGAPQVQTLGEECSSCGATECTDTLKTCNGSTECTAWLGCLTACDSSDCVTGCDDKYADAARIYSPVYDCMCTSCTAACTGADACGKKTCVDDNPLATTQTEPATLAETGLYATLDGAGGDGSGGAGGAGGVDLAMPIAIASYVKTFEPKYPLWADGATKQRFVYIPKCSTIDTSDMDHWSFPVGTRFWKEFTVDNKVVETRMIHRWGTHPTDWIYAAYQWDVTKPTDPTAAKLVDSGVTAANGTAHDIPTHGACLACHNGLPEKILGFSAFQLSHAPAGNEVAIDKLGELGWLSKPAPAGGYPVPGNAVQQAALGYLHGNCGGCHNDVSLTPLASPQILRLSVANADYATTPSVLTTVSFNVYSSAAGIAGLHRIEPMDPAQSAILIRMLQANRDTSLQMPPAFLKATHVADDTGIATITAWINSIPKP